MSTAKGVVILGSSRSRGNTALIVNRLQQITGFEVLDLATKRIDHYDYDHNYENDDFQELFRTVASQYETIVFATPVYWYAMSGRLKVFFDRITDFLKNEQETALQLRGKKMAVISCSNDEAINEGFEVPFRETAAYLGMNYKGHYHTWLEHNKIPEAVEMTLKKLDTTIKK
ncbi:flavodoxin family protein [Flavobacteriaceae bacterium M23B6Z8]